ncbi:hypothetical protein C0995_006448 [Termitomyces sp. Mi166|nr:hypothetical protein C0995_006448 [Termitomyces sp. Mi166\
MKSDGKKTTQNYQDDVMVSLPHEYDLKASPDNEESDSTADGVFLAKGQALDNCESLDSFVDYNRDFHSSELSNED